MIKFEDLSRDEQRSIKRALRALPPDTRLDDLDWQAIIRAVRSPKRKADAGTTTVSDLLREIDANSERRRAQLIAELTERLEQIGRHLRPRAVRQG